MKEWKNKKIEWINRGQLYVEAENEKEENFKDQGIKIYRGWWFEDEARSTSENNVSIARNFVGRVVHALLFSPRHR